jgi:hypothetical protein
MGQGLEEALALIFEQTNAHNVVLSCIHAGTVGLPFPGGKGSIHQGGSKKEVEFAGERGGATG